MRAAPHQNWGYWLVAVPAIAVVAVLLGLPTPMRGLAVLLALGSCPGVAVVPFLRLRSGISAAAVAVVVSLSVNTLVSQVFLLSGLWQPIVVLHAIWLISALGAAWHWSIRNPSQNVQPPERMERLLEKAGWPWSRAD